MSRFNPSQIGELEHRGYDVTWYGADPTGTNDSTTAINNAIAAKVPLYFPRGTYKYSGSITLDSTNDIRWIGAGSVSTTIEFTNSTVSSLISRLNQQSEGWTIQGITFKGPGQAAGTNVNGITSTKSAQSNSYNLRFVDVAVTDVSGDGFHITDWFQQYYSGCYARNIGGNGFYLSGDQSTTFLGAGSFNNAINGYSWWFVMGHPFLTDLNASQVFGGLRLGTYNDATLGTNYCRATIVGMNLEHVQSGGTGIYIDNGSSIASQSGISMYANGTAAQGGNVQYGVYIVYMNNPMLFLDQIAFSQLNGAVFTNRIYVVGNSSDANILHLGDYTKTDYNKTNTVVNIKTQNGWMGTDSLLTSTLGFKNQGQYLRNTAKVTAAYNIRRDSGQQTDDIVLCDATSGAFSISLDYASYLQGRDITIKKIDSSANAVTVSTIGGTFDGATNFVLSAQYKYVHVVSDGTNWNIVGSN